MRKPLTHPLLAINVHLLKFACHRRSIHAATNDVLDQDNSLLAVAGHTHTLSIGFLIDEGVSQKSIFMSLRIGCEQPRLTARSRKRVPKLGSFLDARPSHQVVPLVTAHKKTGSCDSLLIANVL